MSRGRRPDLEPSPEVARQHQRPLATNRQAGALIVEWTARGHTPLEGAGGAHLGDEDVALPPREGALGRSELHLRACRGHRGSGPARHIGVSVLVDGQRLGEIGVLRAADGPPGHGPVRSQLGHIEVPGTDKGMYAPGDEDFALGRHRDGFGVEIRDHFRPGERAIGLDLGDVGARDRSQLLTPELCCPAEWPNHVGVAARIQRERMNPNVLRTAGPRHTLHLAVCTGLDHKDLFSAGCYGLLRPEPGIRLWKVEAGKRSCEVEVVLVEDQLARGDTLTATDRRHPRRLEPSDGRRVGLAARIKTVGLRIIGRDRPLRARARSRDGDDCADDQPAAETVNPHVTHIRYGHPVTASSVACYGQGRTWPDPKDSDSGSLNPSFTSS